MNHANRYGINDVHRRKVQIAGSLVAREWIMEASSCRYQERSDTRMAVSSLDVLSPWVAHLPTTLKLRQLFADLNHAQDASIAKKRKLRPKSAN